MTYTPPTHTGRMRTFELKVFGFLLFCIGSWRSLYRPWPPRCLGLHCNWTKGVFTKVKSIGGSLNKNVPQRFVYLTTRFPVSGTVWRGFQRQPCWRKCVTGSRLIQVPQDVTSQLLVPPCQLSGLPQRQTFTPLQLSTETHCFLRKLPWSCV